MCVGINHALKAYLLYILTIPELCVIKNDILQDLFFKKKLISKHQNLGMPMTKMCIPHTLIDLGPID